MKVIALPEVEQYLMDLIRILYEEEYFGFEENAIKYVEELFTCIKESLPIMSKRISSSYFDKYGKGMYYAMFRKSRNTQWYVFFHQYQENGETIYLVRYISNNHMIAQYL